MSGEPIDAPDPDDIDAALTGGPATEQTAEGASDGSVGGSGGQSAETAAEPSQERGGSLIDQLLEAATRSPDKSLREIDKSEYFDPENGGTDRLTLVFDDVVTNGDGLQNWMHLLVAVAEIAVSDEFDGLPQGSEGGDSDEPGSDSQTELGFEVAGDGT